MKTTSVHCNNCGCGCFIVDGFSRPLLFCSYCGEKLTSKNATTLEYVITLAAPNEGKMT